jgi:hypothetical protein
MMGGMSIDEAELWQLQDSDCLSSALVVCDNASYEQAEW